MQDWSDGYMTEVAYTFTIIPSSIPCAPAWPCCKRGSFRPMSRLAADILHAHARLDGGRAPAICYFGTLPRSRETARDVIVNRLFRRDYWVRGAHRQAARAGDIGRGRAVAGIACAGRGWARTARIGRRVCSGSRWCGNRQLGIYPPQARLIAIAPAACSGVCCGDQKCSRPGRGYMKNIVQKT